MGVLRAQARELVDLATIGDQEISNDQVLFVVKRAGAVGGDNCLRNVFICLVCISVCVCLCAA